MVSTYLLLVIILLLLINVFIGNTILKIYLNQAKLDFLTHANTLSNSIRYYMEPEQKTSFAHYIKKVTDNYSERINSRILVIDSNKIVIHDSNSIYIGQEFNHTEIQRALDGENNYGIYKFKEFGYVLYTAVPISFNNRIVGSILVSSSIDEIFDTTGEIKRVFIIISGISVVFIAILGFIFAGFLSRPIKKFTNTITKISQGQLDQKVEIKTNDEFNHMANAFNLMISKLDQVDRQRKDFVANVSHELRTPLSSIKLLSESLIHQDEKDINIYKEFLIDINAEVNRLNNIINDLLTLVDLNKEKLTLSLKTTYINYLLEKVILRLRPLANEESITLELISKQQIQINIDVDKIQQSIINIIHNAIKYTPEGGAVTVSLYYEGEYAVIKVEDTGTGIERKHLEHIFDRFYRTDKARARKTGGTGLGLSIAYQIVSLHQGTIEVESEVGKGSSFYIKLPRNLG